ncbi:SCO-spondin [Osmerus eperlanus]|uniref:SCO-spondin n=1 Tax=Osmerus eperlanus TaxID=29151 RepID=UPI002E1263DA
MWAVLLSLTGLSLVMGMRHWCERTVEEREERVLTPRLQREVACSQVYQYDSQGWRLDLDRMRHRHGDDDGIALYYRHQGPGATCYLYKPPQIQTQQVNRTVQGCCEGWSGPQCSQGVGVRGQCYSTWSCDDFPGVQNSSLMPLEQCCGTLWGLSWRNASDQTCLSCSYTLLPDAQSPLVRGGLLRSSRAPQGAATCLSWGGAHYRTFDRKPFHFRGTCTYVLASSSDGTWAVYISTVCDARGPCSRALRMMLGLNLVSIHLRNLTLNGLLVPQGEPLFQNGVSVHWLGDFVFVESGLGVRVKFDMRNTVYLTVTAEHLTTTRGLCGVYNNKPDDDFSSRLGDVYQFAASFGNSWRVFDQHTEGCSDAAELGHSCDAAGDGRLRGSAEAVCHRLLESPFTRCHQWVDPEEYVDTCLYLYCSLGPQERDDSTCDTLASYARECAQHHVIISWRGAQLCERVCPRDQVFSDCVSSCPPTCSSPQPPSGAGQCREECVGGCECPPGRFLHQGACLRKEDCPCFHRRRTYQSGDAIQQRCNTCVCRAGQWQCSGERCEAQCSLMGALQVSTFDKKRYSLQGGACSFIAVEDFVDRKLEVRVGCGECVMREGQGCLREMSITALRTTITITESGAVLLNSQKVALPVETGDLVVSRPSSSFLLVQTFGAQLLWHLDGPLVLITLQPGFSHKVRGLCGTLTWTQLDDFTTPEGDVETSVPAFVSRFSLGPCLLPGGQGPGGQGPDACSSFSQRRQHAEQVCSIIHSPAFQPCHDVVEREPYMRVCLGEVCGCSPRGLCHCAVLTAYARHCAQEGAPVAWRNHTFCPLQCTGGQVYQECGRACGTSCADLQRGRRCVGTPRSCVPGCQCPPGLAQDQQGQCVPVGMCPCRHGDTLYQTGSVLQKGCNTWVFFCCLEVRVFFCCLEVRVFFCCLEVRVFFCCLEVFLGNHDDHGVVEVRLDRMVAARFVRVLPHDFQNGIYLRLELMGCGDAYRWLSTPLPPVSPPGPCRGGQFHCGNGRCVPGGPQGVVCDGVNNCGDGTDELHCGIQPSPTPRGCPRGQYSCPPPGGCISGLLRCDGVAHCPRGEDEEGCQGHITPRPAPLRTPSMAAVTQATPTQGGPGYRGVCSSPLGLEDGRIRYGQLTSSSSRENNPADAGRLNIVPNVQVMEPGWSPLPADPQPYFQVDLLEPTWVSGVVTQGGERMWGYLSKYRLAFALVPSHFSNYTQTSRPGSPPKVFEVRMVGRAPVTRWLERLVRARYLRIIPLEFRHTFYLRVEVLGCRGDELVTPSSVTTSPPGGGVVTVHRCRPGQFACRGGRECVPVSALCDVRQDCQDHSDELNCGTAPTGGLPGIQNHTLPTGSPGFHNYTTGAPGLHSTTPQDGRPGVASSASPGLQPSSPHPGPPALHSTAAWTTPHDGGLPRVLCLEGQFTCRAGGCVDARRVCDGRRDCLDGSDEERCGPTASPSVSTQRPLVPSPCSHKQFSCLSGECVHLGRKCDLTRDCADGSDERNCVDCIMSGWSQWSRCSVTCGLGSLFRQRSIQRDALHGGSCGGAQYDSRACFPQACPVDGQWSEWTEWSRCDVMCGGGVRRRNRTCSDPPPKNGGRDCGGMTLQSQSCNSQPCGSGTDTQTGCSNGMVLVQERDCQAAMLDPCPPTCSDLSSATNCSSTCLPGCRCAPGLFLQNGRCVSSSQCLCHWGGLTLKPGHTFTWESCHTCVCQHGLVTCDNSSCVALCDWSAWSSWTPCDSTCGVGIQQRYRSTVSPPGGSRVQPCSGDSAEARQCYTPCPPGPDQEGALWGEWTVWSDCSKTCFNHVDQVGLRRRFRSCNHTHSHTLNHTLSHTLNHTLLTSGCEGHTEEQEPCNTVHCPVAGGWSDWSPWSQCSSDCDSGVQTRRRSCNTPSPQQGGTTCPGPHIQTRDCNSHPCSGVCPEGMVYMTAQQCGAQGGACPRVCLDVAAGEVQCATRCYDGCYCGPALYLLNHTCVPRALCPCYHRGALHPAGTTLPGDACNNCTCRNGEMECSSSPCPVDCGWSSWTRWSACSRTCDVGVRRRYRSGTNPPPAFGGRVCRGDRIGLDTCSLEPCQGVKEPWGPWSECSVSCGGGYRNRTRGPFRTHGTAQQFSACSLQPCAGGVCPGGQEWKVCVIGPVTCSDLSLDRYRNCTPGCQCPRGTLLQDGVCVWESECRCDVDGAQYEPGDTVTMDCNNCTCDSGRLVNCTQSSCDVDGQWSAWTPWGQCSVACGAGFQSRYRFCSSPQRSGSGLSCLGPDRQDRVCMEASCSRDGGWGSWSNWTDCTKSCGGGVQSRRRECDRPAPEGQGDYCEGLGSEVTSCNTDHCPVAPCSQVPGTAFSSCGPSCPRSCDDLAHCGWRCEPGCYCTGGKVLSANGTSCLEREDCPCLDLSTGHRLHPGASTLAPDRCNNCTCEGGRLNCTRDPCPVEGGWCEWSEWTPCSKPCGAEWVSRYRSCDCPRPRGGGAPCLGEQELHHGLGTQIQRQPCPLLTFCPVHGSWSPWSSWSECEGCAGVSVRSRRCSSPPARFGGRPCLGESRQSRGCHDNSTVCPDCGGGQGEWACGKPCPRSCSDLHGDVVCVESPGCVPTCGCPGNTVLQDGRCVEREECRCKYHNHTASTGVLDSSNTSWAWPGEPDWLYVDPGDTISSRCQNCSCEAGVLLCQSVPGCHVDGGWSQWGAWSQCSTSCGGGATFRVRQCDNPAPQGGGRGCVGVAEQQRECNTHTCTDAGPWQPWSLWSVCSVSCGGGEQSRNRLCYAPPCSGVTRQSKTCNTHVCLEVGCPPGRLYRECERGEGCPFSCAQVSRREGCYSDGCEEGCHCPPRTFQHHGACLQECPCLVEQDLLADLRSVASTPGSTLDLYNITEGAELRPGDTLVHDCSSCSCQQGRWNCSLQACPVDGGESPWGPWGPCSLSCGGLGLKSRARSCSQPPPAHGGRPCPGPLQETAYCQAPDCPVIVAPTEEPIIPDEDAGFSPWSAWSSCSRSCSDAISPALKSRQRRCETPPCSGGTHQERACNLPQCPGEVCEGGDCVSRNCSWTEWADWTACSRSCGVGQQQRIRTFLQPGAQGAWCHDILGGNVELRFCNIRACQVDGGWSRWSSWSRCDRRCGGGRSVRTRSCSSPPPKNAGRRCEGEKNQVKPCNTRPCDESGCPPGQEFVACANACPQRCSDLQQGLQCQGNTDCQTGCRCPKGQLQQGGVCVKVWQCDCVDSLGHSWAAGSQHQLDCNNCSCADGQLSCTNHSCLEASCTWSPWSSWASCSVSCGRGQRTRFRSLIPETGEADCNFEEVEHKPCDPGTCPPLCVHGDRELSVGDTWLQGECEQCTCTPEGDYCQDFDCRVDGDWTPWSVWSDCSVTCGRGSQVRTRACINPPPRNNGSTCSGPEREAQDCLAPPCLDDLCPWSRWSACSRSCGAGLILRRRKCVCEAGGEMACPADIEAERNREETQLCYTQPCPGCPMSGWSVWSTCSCVSQRQHRHRAPLSLATRGQQCTHLDTQSRECSLDTCHECEPPFQYSACGAPCEQQCDLQGQTQSCAGGSQCTPGCYCPQGLLQQNRSCVPPEQCGCVYLQHPASGPPLPTTLPLGEEVTLGCSTCLCHKGRLQCDSRECEVILSEWSEWTPCSPCVLRPLPPAESASLVSLQRRYRACLDLDSGMPLSVMGRGAEGQCPGELEEERVCPQPNACTDQCQWSVWSVWSVCQEPCSGGVRHRHRQPQPPGLQPPGLQPPGLQPPGLQPPGLQPPGLQPPGLQPPGLQPPGLQPPGLQPPGLQPPGLQPPGLQPPGPHCGSQQTQTQSCNTGLCPGERCEDRGRTFQESCANQCPRSCADLWEHVQCLQGVCHSGCRCPDGSLLQDGFCVPASQCRCGVPAGNGTLEIPPGETVTQDCNTCVCENGSLVCPARPCPVYQPWSPWSSCSTSCGRGQRTRTRPCQDSEGGPSCEDSAQVETCELPSCPAGCVLSEWSSWSECSASCGGGVSLRNKTILQPPEPGGLACSPPLEQHTACNTNSCLPDCPAGQVFSRCAGVCPHTCEDLRPQTECLPAACSPGCSCPPPQVLHRGVCVAQAGCPCSPLSLPGGNGTQPDPQEEVEPGTVVMQRCNTCVCRAGTFNCTTDVCAVDCEWAVWSAWGPCSVSCGSGQRGSSRGILRPRLYGGQECEGPSQRSTPCTAPDCACPSGERWRGEAAQVCERTCVEMYQSAPFTCSHAQGCVCQDGLYRNTHGHCVIPALCPCEEGGQLLEAGTEWDEGCLVCRCVNGKKLCQSRCPPLYCNQGEVKVEDPGSCCPVCRKEFPGDPVPECRRFTEVRNITKGDCRLDNVEVSFCRGRCLSRTDVILEEPYLQAVCDCCSYRLDPERPVLFLSLQCSGGESEPVVLPVIHSCECTSCQGGDLSER